jgi:hypothetical protein
MSNPGASATPTQTYVEYRANLEQPAPDEEDFITKIVNSLHRNNEWAFKKYKHGIRDAHAKSHGILRGELRVYPDLAGHLAQGLFATPRTYPVIARISSTHPAIRPDKIRGIRAIAIKVLEVEGERLSADGVHTQDFVLVNHPDFPYADARDYYKKGMPSARILARSPDTALWIFTEVLASVQRILNVFGRGLPAALALFTGPNNLILGETFHSAAPLRYGKYVAKLSLEPYSKSVRRLQNRRLPHNGRPDAHREMIADFFSQNNAQAEYEIRAQLCTNTETMPIEDATVHWPEEESLPRGVARITFGEQHSDGVYRRAFGDDVLSFNSWRGLVAHRPLGSINRLKKRVYDASSDYRHMVNNAPQKEPTSIDDLPPQ